MDKGRGAELSQSIKKLLKQLGVEQVSELLRDYLFTFKQEDMTKLLNILGDDEPIQADKKIRKSLKIKKSPKLKRKYLEDQRIEEEKCCQGWKNIIWLRG